MASINSEAKEDMISRLPDEILVHILSFLRIEDAIKATLLIKRFRNLWRSFPRLTLDRVVTLCDLLREDDFSPCYDENFAKLIHHVLIFHERVEIDELCLRHRFFFKFSKDPDYSTNPDPELEIRIIEEKRFAGVLNSLVSFAIIKRCKVLSLEFLSSEELHQSYILPTIVYRGIYLTKLTLGACDITSCDEVWLKSLKMLSFKGVVMSDNAMEKILLGCPSLKELSVDCCYGLRNLCFSNSIKLKKLKIRHFQSELLRVSNLNVVCLNITMSWIEGVVILNATVVDATVCCNMFFKYKKRSYEGFKFLLQSLDQCKTFRPCPWSVVVLAIWELTNTPCPNFKWKQLLVELHLRNCVQIGLSMLLRHVPLLETLQIHVQPEPKFEVTIKMERKAHKALPLLVAIGEEGLTLFSQR